MKAKVLQVGGVPAETDDMKNEEQPESTAVDKNEVNHRTDYPGIRLIRIFSLSLRQGKAVLIKGKFTVYHLALRTYFKSQKPFNISAQNTMLAKDPLIPG